MAAPSVAFDVGPLLGRRTGIGAAVAALERGLTESNDVTLVPYVTSFRGSRPAGVHRLGIPAAVAHRLWAHRDWPRLDRWVPGAAVVHGTNYVVPPSRLPRVVSVYDCWFLRNGAEANPAVVRAGRVLARSLGTGAVAHASSGATADAIRELFPGTEVRTILLGAVHLVAPPSACPIPELAGRPFLVSISTLERRKNLPALVDAFGSIAHLHPELALVMAGAAGDDALAVDAAIDRLDPAVTSRVMRTGFVDDTTRSWLLHHAVALCYPSLDEGFGFPLLDAMQASTAIVATSVGSIPEVTGDAALLVPVGDHDALAGALDAVAGDDSRRASLAAAGTRRLEHFTWERTTRAMIHLYSELAETAR